MNYFSTVELPDSLFRHRGVMYVFPQIMWPNDIREYMPVPYCVYGFCTRAANVRVRAVVAVTSSLATVYMFSLSLDSPTRQAWPGHWSPWSRGSHSPCPPDSFQRWLSCGREKCDSCNHELDSHFRVFWNNPTPFSCHIFFKCFRNFPKCAHYSQNSVDCKRGSLVITTRH